METKKIALKLNMIEHAGFNSLNAMINTTGNYGFIGALAENCCMIAQCATINLQQASPSAFGRAQIPSSYINLVCLHVFYQTGLLQEMIRHGNCLKSFTAS